MPSCGRSHSSRRCLRRPRPPFPPPAAAALRAHGPPPRPPPLPRRRHGQARRGAQRQHERPLLQRPLRRRLQGLRAHACGCAAPRLNARAPIGNGHGAAAARRTPHVFLHMLPTPSHPLPPCLGRLAERPVVPLHRHALHDFLHHVARVPGGWGAAPWVRGRASDHAPLRTHPCSARACSVPRRAAIAPWAHAWRLCRALNAMHACHAGAGAAEGDRPGDRPAQGLWHP